MKLSASDLLAEVTAAGLSKAFDLDPQAVEAARERAQAISEKMHDRIQTERDPLKGADTDDGH